MKKESKDELLRNEEAFARAHHVSVKLPAKTALSTDGLKVVEEQMNLMENKVKTYFNSAFEEAFKKIQEHIFKNAYKKDKINTFMLNIKRNKLSFFSMLAQTIECDCVYEDLTNITLKKLKECSDKISNMTGESSHSDTFVFKLDVTENPSFKMINLILNTFFTLCAKINHTKKIFFVIVVDQLTSLFQNLDINLLSKIDLNNFLVVDTKFIFNKVVKDYFYSEFEAFPELKRNFYGDNSIFSYLDGNIKSVTVESFMLCFKLFLVDYCFFGKRSSVDSVNAVSDHEKLIFNNGYQFFLFRLIESLSEFYCTDEDNFSQSVFFFELFQSFSANGRQEASSSILDKFSKQKSLVIEHNCTSDSIYTFENEFHLLRGKVETLLKSDKELYQQVAMIYLNDLYTFLNELCLVYPISSDNMQIPITKAMFAEKMYQVNSKLADALTKFTVVEKKYGCEGMLTAPKMKMRILAFFAVVKKAKENEDTVFSLFYAFIDTYLSMNGEFTVDLLYAEYLNKVNSSNKDKKRVTLVFQKCLIEFLHTKLLSKEGEQRLIKNYFARIVLFK